MIIIIIFCCCCTICCCLGICYNDRDKVKEIEDCDDDDDIDDIQTVPVIIAWASKLNRKSNPSKKGDIGTHDDGVP